jgi:hypothetical protein
VSPALQIYYTAFDAAFFKLPPNVQARIEAKIDEMGMRLGSFPHHRLTGTNRYRLREAMIGLFIRLTFRKESFIYWQ